MQWGCGVAMWTTVRGSAGWGVGLGCVGLGWVCALLVWPSPLRPQLHAACSRLTLQLVDVSLVVCCAVLLLLPFAPCRRVRWRGAVPHLLLRRRSQGAHAAHELLRHVRHGLPQPLRAEVVHGKPEGEVPHLPATVGWPLSAEAEDSGEKRSSFQFCTLILMLIQLKKPNSTFSLISQQLGRLVLSGAGSFLRSSKFC